ncbi:MAG: response regulator transcription factor [Epsilonproteobacteria bacterium]|nr:response regulator transcription factor [Campylobacterota bacterium]
MSKILLLEDDELFAETLLDSLEEFGYDVTHISNGEKFLELAYERVFDVYLLDINVPLLSGIESLIEIRKSNDTTPAIFLTSYKDKETLKNGFLSGCDDYLTKPFDLEELDLRIRSLLKRSGKVIDVIKFDTLVYNPMTQIITKNGIDIICGQKVNELFKLFFENRGKIVTKEMIIERLWGYDEEYSEGSIRVYITRLQKLFDTKKIYNIKNVGYKVEF